MKKGFLNILAIISFLVAFLLIPKSVYAATVNIEKSVDSVKPGGDVTVYIKTSDIGNDSIKDYELNLSYDASKLDFKAGDGNGISSVSAANPIIIKKTKAENIQTDGTTIATIVFTAKNSPGDANLTLNSTSCKTISNADCKTNNVLIKVKGYSNDASLSSLKIPNATINPKFDKNVTEYTSTIQDITEVTVNAIASDSNAKIMISDNYKNLQKGENEIKITVTAEDGKTSKTYVIKVTLKLTPTDEEVLKASANLSSIDIKGFNLDFTKELKKYTLTVPYKITKLDIKATPENEKATVKIDGNNKLKVGRNIVRINVTSEDEQNKETYVINVNRSKEEKKIVQTCPDVTSKKEWIMFSVCTFLTFTLGIILGYFLSKKEVLKKIFKKKEKGIDEDFEDTIEVPSTKKKGKTKKD